MAFINTDEGAFINSAQIVSVQRTSELYQVRMTGSGALESCWDLTVKLSDGSVHEITARRAVEAKEHLNLPEASVRQDEEERREAERIVTAPHVATEADERLVEESMEAIAREGVASVGTLRRVLRITNGEATRALNLLAARGYISADEKDGTWEILIDLLAMDHRGGPSTNHQRDFPAAKTANPHAKPARNADDAPHFSNDDDWE